MTAPPRKCAVSGMPNTSGHDPRASVRAPPSRSTRAAMASAARWASGRWEGLGSPWPCALVMTMRPNRRRSDSVSELSADCMTSAMMPRSLQRCNDPSRHCRTG